MSIKDDYTQWITNRKVVILAYKKVGYKMDYWTNKLEKKLHKTLDDIITYME